MMAPAISLDGALITRYVWIISVSLFTSTKRYAHLTDAALKRGANVMGRLVQEAKEKSKEEETAGRKQI